MTFDQLEKVTHCLLCETTDLRLVDIKASIWQCNRCKFKFVSPRPTQNSIIQSYDTGQVYDQWIVDGINRQILWERRFKRLQKLTPNGKILDVGAGIGTFLNVAQKNGLEVYGTETSITAVSKAKELYNIDLMVGQIEDQKLKWNRFDIITMWHVLEHVPYPVRTLKECFRLLKPNGFLVVATPNDFELRTQIKKILRLDHSIYRPLVSSQEIHLTHFTPQTISYAMKKSGFSIHELSLDEYLPLFTFKTKIRYKFFNFIKTFTNYNLYDTIFAIGEK